MFSSNKQPFGVESDYYNDDALGADDAASPGIFDTITSGLQKLTGTVGAAKDVEAAFRGKNAEAPEVAAPKKSTNWLLYGGIATAAVLAVTTVIVLKRRKSSPVGA